MNDDAIRELSRRLGELQRTFDAFASQTVAALQQVISAVNATLHSQSVYLGNNRALTFLHSGQKIFVDTRSVDIGTHLLMQGLWEPNYVQAFLGMIKPGNVVLDIGANHGVYALLAARKVGPSGRVVAFEPNPVFADLIRASVSVNGLGGIVTLVQAAVADKACEMELVGDPLWSGGTHLQTEADASPTDIRYRVNCIVLDDLPELAQARVDAIKMDIEGAEGLALHGMQRLLDRLPRVKIMLEFCPAMLANYPIDAPKLIEFFDARGFFCWGIKDDGTMSPESWGNLLNERDRIRNVVASRFALD